MKTVRKTVFGRPVPGVRLFLWGAGGGAGRELRDAAGGADGGCLCGPPPWPLLRRALPKALEVRSCNECFMLNLAPALFAVQRLYIFILLMYH